MGQKITVSVLGLAMVLAGGCRRGTGEGTTPEVTPSGAPVSAETRGDFENAVKTLNQASQGGLEEGECRGLVRSFEKISGQVEHGLPEALFNAGRVWERCGERDKARSMFEESNKAAKRHTKGKAAGFAQALVHLGVYAYEKGDKAGAKRLFDQARAADRRSTEAYTNLGLLDREAENWSAAQLNLRRALAVNSDYITAFTQMALLYLEIAERNRQMLDITVLVCQQAVSRGQEIKAAPLDVAPIHNVWGLALLRKGDVVRAVEQFDAARQLSPNFFEAHMNFGAVNLSFRGYEAAEGAFRKAVALQPENYEAHLSLGAALRGMERYGDARASFEKARQIDGKAPGAYYNLAVLMQDYELTTAGGMPEQIKVLSKAKGIFREFVDKCRGRREACVRKRVGEEDQDMTKVAQKRMKAIDQTISGLREAQQLAEEAARLEAGSKKL
jgi:tetratricopeptide (TPR) repeat protein